MVKDANRNCMYDWGERAVPTLMISHQKCSKCPRLETIAEEAGIEDLEAGHKIVKFMFLVPVFISVVSYLLLYRHIN